MHKVRQRLSCNSLEALNYRILSFLFVRNFTYRIKYGLSNVSKLGCLPDYLSPLLRVSEKTWHCRTRDVWKLVPLGASMKPQVLKYLHLWSWINTRFHGTILLQVHSLHVQWRAFFLKKEREGPFLWQGPWRKTRKVHKHSSLRHIHPESACVGIMKILWASAHWRVRAVLMKQVTDETPQGAAADWCTVRTIPALKNIWITSRVDTQPADLGK